MEQLEVLSRDSKLLFQAVDAAQKHQKLQLEPASNELEEIILALKEIEVQIEDVTTKALSGNFTGALSRLLGEKAEKLEQERTNLQQRNIRLEETINLGNITFDVDSLKAAFDYALSLSQGGKIEHLKAFLRQVVKRIEWDSTGAKRVGFFGFRPASQKNKNQNFSCEKSWFDTEVWTDCPQGRYVEPMWMEFFFIDSALQEEATLFCTSEDDARWSMLTNESSSSSERADNGLSIDHQEMEAA